jgi:molybdopterin-guanine dinucleotide biosynthesis protein A
MGQSPSAEESQQISDLIDVTLAELQARNVCLVTIDADYIPDEFFMPLGRIVAAAAAPEFGQEANQAVYALAQKGERDLKHMTAPVATREIAEGQYF